MRRILHNSASFWQGAGNGICTILSVLLLLCLLCASSAENVSFPVDSNATTSSSSSFLPETGGRPGEGQENSSGLGSASFRSQPGHLTSSPSATPGEFQPQALLLSDSPASLASRETSVSPSSSLGGQPSPALTSAEAQLRVVRKHHQPVARDALKVAPHSLPLGKADNLSTNDTLDTGQGTGTDTHRKHAGSKTGCPAGRYGGLCAGVCGRCRFGHPACSAENGVCRYGCRAGWMGVRCQTPCPPGTWGDHCYGCGRCLGEHAQCDKISGQCRKGCREGWYGPRCLAQCGHCRYGVGACHPVSGVCEGGCMTGWAWSTCHAPCQDTLWGENCAHLCGQCAEERCNSTDGTCAKGCAAGWTDAYCTTPCNGDTFGPNCSLTCGHCRPGNGSDYSTCDRETGACSAGCDPGWRKERCDAPCEGGTFGLNCSLTCPNCSTGCTCNPVTGSCDNPLCPVSSIPKGGDGLEAALVAVSTALGLLLILTLLLAAAHARRTLMRAWPRMRGAKRHTQRSGSSSNDNPTPEESSPTDSASRATSDPSSASDTLDSQDGQP